MKGAVRVTEQRQRTRKRGRRSATTPDFKALFDSVPDPCLVLDPHFTIVAVNQAYLRATLTESGQIMGRHIFEVFPDNPADQEAAGVRNLQASLMRVLTSGVADTMPIQKYDIRSDTPPLEFMEHYWSAVNTPVLGEDGRVRYIIHRVQDVTDYVRLKSKDTETEARVVEQREHAERLEGELYAKTRDIAAAHRELVDTVRALTATRKMFESFMGHLPAAAWMKDMQGHYVYANPETERLFGVPAGSLLGKTSEEVFAPEVARQFFDIDRKVLEDQGNLPPVHLVQEVEGEERHLLVSKFVIRDGEGRGEYLAGVAIDTTETRRMEAEIQRLASFPLFNPNPVLELSLEGEVTFCNPAAVEVLQQCSYSAECNPFIPADLREIIGELLEDESAQHVREVQVGERFFEEVISLLPQARSVRCYTMDVTKRKRAEQEREHLLLQLQAVLENINEGVVLADLAGNIMNMNKEALNLHGFTDVEEVRRHLSGFGEIFELHTLKGEPIPLEEWPLMRSLKGERFFDYEVRVHNKVSGSGWVGSYNGTPVRNSNGDPMLAVVTIRDLTRRIEMEEQIVKLNLDLASRVAELERTNQELEAFNRMVSHDLRQPLNTIATSCQAVQMLCDVGPECRSYIDIAYNKVLVMNDLIDSLLTFSRSTHRELKREKVDLSELAENIFAGIKVAEPQRRVSLRAAQHLVANGDANLLRSVLENLIGNAWKYSSVREEALIEFGCSVFNGENTFFVRDNGAGFDPGEVESLFTPFRRLPGAEQFGGFGIGLATVERIVRRHGGQVCADAEPGKGATFYFTLPDGAP